MLQNNFFNTNPFALPHTFKFDNGEYEVRTSFRNWIKLSLLYDDKTLSEEDKIPVALQLVFQDVNKLYEAIKENKINLVDVFKAINKFFNCGNENKEESKNNDKYFDFKQDWDYIYSAFMQQYKIDLNEEKLHWFKFISLFKGLSSETEFLKIIGYRSVDLNKVPKEQRKFYRKMKEKYALIDEYSIKEEACLMDEDLEQILEKMKRG